jgi:opacity protein-like surface antigen
MKLIKQLKLSTLQVIISLIFLNTQISFAQNKINYEGPYVGVGIQSLDGGVNGNYEDGYIHSRDIDGQSMEFHIGYNKDLTQYGFNNYIAGVELSYSDHDFLFNGVKSKRDCPSADWNCKSSINYSWTAKTKLGLKYDNLLPNLFIGYTNNQITIKTDQKDGTGAGGTTKTVEGVLYGVGVDYYLDSNSFIGFSFHETQMNKENFKVDTGHIISTKLKYNTAKLTYNYRF